MHVQTVCTRTRLRGSRTLLVTRAVPAPDLRQDITKKDTRPFSGTCPPYICYLTLHHHRWLQAFSLLTCIHMYWRSRNEANLITAMGLNLNLDHIYHAPKSVLFCNNTHPHCTVMWHPVVASVSHKEECRVYNMAATVILGQLCCCNWQLIRQGVTIVWYCKHAKPTYT